VSDQKLTIVTGLFDLGRHEANPQRQSAAFYLEHGREVLQLDRDMVVFLEPALLDAVSTMNVDLTRKRIIPCHFEDMPAYALRGLIEEARIKHPLHHANLDKDTALYGTFQRVKLQLLRRAADLNPFDATHFAWVDFGISKAVPMEHVERTFDQALALDKVQLLVTNQLLAEPDWQEIRHAVMAGYIAGDRDSVLRFCDQCEETADALLARGFAPHDETLLEAIAVTHPELITRKFSGHHTRIFHDCAPPIGLVMIVKNEVHGLAETLNSFKPFIDRWTILDTGSTDGTQELIRQTLDGVPGQLFEEPFVDFSTSRNRALDLHGTSTVFAVMPDSDDKLVDGAALREFCEGMQTAFGLAHDAYLLNLRRGQDLNYYLPLVMRTGIGWRYRGRVHECSGRPDSPNPVIHVPSAHLTKTWREQSLEATKARWQRDLELLRADLLADPKDPRAAFYLGQTYECLGRSDDALRAYQHRIELGGWFEETFIAKLRTAKILDAIKRPWSEVQQAFLDAFQADPRRAEPLYYLAKYHYDRDEHGLVCLFAGRAAELPTPHTALFVDFEIYEWKIADLLAISGFYVGNQLSDKTLLAASERAAEKAVAAHPNDERMRSNRMFYTRSAAELFVSYRDQPIDFRPELPYRAMNPSVWYDGERWRCVIRTVNYHIVKGQYLTPDDNVIYTRNYMAELSDDLSIQRVIEMIDHVDVPRSTFPVHGFEDCRLFSVGAQLYCTSTACDLNDERGNREIVLLTLDENYGIREAQPLRGVWSALHQKNWMPFVRDGQVYLIYSTKPEAVFALSDGQVDLRDTTTVATGRLRGGSQAVRVPDGWLFLVHDVVWSSGRIYLHRFVLMNDDFKVTKMSDLFYFKQRGIEFCAGLGFDGERLVASFAVNDETAHLAVFDWITVRANLHADYVI
jgi:predicted GH43/DUF377 family glycosyl hydrolase